MSLRRKPSWKRWDLCSDKTVGLLHLQKEWVLSKLLCLSMNIIGEVMTRKEIWGSFIKKTVIPVVSVLVLFLIFKSMFTRNGETDYFYVWLCCGIPFGIRRMFMWIVPHGYDIGGTLGIIALNFIVGGLIGIVILFFRLLCAAWYVPLTIYRLITEANQIKE